MKSSILQQLRENSGVLSGEALSSILGVSRVAVWKHIRRLQELGYAIDSTPQGYRLDAAPDTPFPWEFPEREGNIHYQQSVGSTMDLARDLARKDCPAMTVVVAEEQTQGRGRMARQWVSAPKGLYFTVVTRPDLAPAQAVRVGFAAAVSLAQLVRDHFGVPAWVKWPNDLLVGESKLAGMLAEMETAGELVQFINIGIGINVNHHPDNPDVAATSLQKETGGMVSRQAVLKLFLAAFEACLDRIHTTEVIDQWKALTQTLGRQVRVVTRQSTITGWARDVDDTGALKVETAPGEIRLVHYGDCFLLPHRAEDQLESGL